jgi:hypothetical protein
VDGHVEGDLKVAHERAHEAYDGRILRSARDQQLELQVQLQEAVPVDEEARLLGQRALADDGLARPRAA